MPQHGASAAIAGRNGDVGHLSPVSTLSTLPDREIAKLLATDQSVYYREMGESIGALGSRAREKSKTGFAFVVGSRDDAVALLGQETEPYVGDVEMSRTMIRE